MNLTPAEREGYSRDYMLTTDDSGREVFAGLSLDESEWLLQYRRDTALGQDRHARMDDREAHQALVEKHERVRLEVIGTLVAKDTFNPTSH